MKILRELVDPKELVPEKVNSIIQSTAKGAFELMFITFHACQLNDKIDVTFEQDGQKYRLLFQKLTDSTPPRPQES